MAAGALGHALQWFPTQHTRLLPLKQFFINKIQLTSSEYKIDSRGYQQAEGAEDREGTVRLLELIGNAANGGDT